MTAGPSPTAAGPTRPEGDDPATWLDEHGDALFRYALGRVGDRTLAEDLVQDALLGALQARDRFLGAAQVRTWLVSILRRKVVDHFRRTRFAERSGGEPGADAAGAFDARGSWRSAPADWRAPERDLEDREFWDGFDACLRRLPRHLAQAFILRELDGLEPAAVREALGVGESNLRVRLHRARLQLRACLERNGFGDEAGDGPGAR